VGALTTPELIKQWFFGVDTETDWKVGSPILHTGKYQGRPYEHKGNILEIEPAEIAGAQPLEPGFGTSRRSRELRACLVGADRDDGTELTIGESNLASEEAKATSEQSWRAVLENLKKFLEG
jgi:uncharacterized protein YndB with AHSA1/START domain